MIRNNSKFEQFWRTGGFSLVETLVAISLLLIVIAGPMTITARSAKSTTFASEQVQAFFLAQEGIELAQKLRDDLLLQQFNNSTIQAWNQFTTTLYNNCRSASGCALHWESNTGVVSNPLSCAAISNCRLHYRDSDSRGRYTHNSGAGTTPTPFTRQVFFTYNPVSPERVLVRSLVTWRTGSLVSQQSVQVQTYLYNIYPNP